MLDGWIRAPGSVAARSVAAVPSPGASAPSSSRAPRMRYSLRPSQTGSAPTRTCSTTSKATPLRCGRRSAAWTVRVRSSSTPTGRCSVISLATCTMPIAANGKSRRVSRSICRPKVSTCNQVGGTVSRSVKPQTRA